MRSHNVIDYEKASFQLRYQGELKYRADPRFAASQWETTLLCNDVSHWLGTSLESALNCICIICLRYCVLKTREACSKTYIQKQSLCTYICTQVTISLIYHFDIPITLLCTWTTNACTHLLQCTVHDRLFQNSVSYCIQINNTKSFHNNDKNRCPWSREHLC